MLQEAEPVPAAVFTVSETGTLVSQWGNFRWNLEAGSLVNEVHHPAPDQVMFQGTQQSISVYFQTHVFGLVKIFLSFIREGNLILTWAWTH